MIDPKKILACLLFIAIGIQAQVPTNIDSLKRIYHKDPNTLENISLLSQAYATTQPDSALYFAKILLKKCAFDDYDYQARAYTIFGHYDFINNQLDASIANYKKAIELTKKGKLDFIRGIYTSNLAQIYINKGEIRQGIYTYQEAEKLLINHDFENKADYYLFTVYSGLGEGYSFLGLYDKALYYLFKSFKASQKYNDELNMGITQTTIANVYKNMNNWEKHESYNRQALKYFKKVKYTLAEGMTYYNLAENAFQKNNFERTEQLLDSSLHIITDMGTDYSLGDVFNLYGHLKLAQKRFNSSEVYFNKGLSINLKSNLNINTGHSILGLGDLNDQKGNEKVALQFYQKALKIFEKENLPKEKRDVLEKIVDLDFLISQPDSIHYYLDLYKKATVEYLNTEKQRAITGQEILHDTEIKEAKIKTQELQLNSEKSKRIKLVYGIVSLVFLSGFLFFGIQSRQKQKELLTQNTILDMQQHLNQMELQNLNQQLNPHEFKNLLIGIAPEIQEKAPDAYRNMIKLLNLTKATINNNSLTDSIDNQLQQIESFLSLEQNILAVPLHWHIDNQMKHLDAQLPRLLLKNLVENAVKHGIKNKSDGGEIKIHLSQDNQYSYISVIDNGIGIQSQNKSDTGIGLSTYQKLFDSLNNKNKLKAEIQILPQEIGMKVLLKIPLDYRYSS
jgi:tetratricopeptide (TPR) repeat protein